MEAIYIIILFCECFIMSCNGGNLNNSIEENIIQQTSKEIRIVTREEWNARPPKGIEPLSTPTPIVVIHHTYIPPICYTFEDCSSSMRQMQNYHMDDKGWNDIGYNFCVGGDGDVYEGRGFQRLGAHAMAFNRCSIGICLIGDFRYSLPTTPQLETTKLLIKEAVTLGYLAVNYTLLAHRQVRDTECPGDALFKDVNTWNHFRSGNFTDCTLNVD